MKEVRGQKLIELVRVKIPGAGFVKPVNDRKVAFTFRGFDFLISSRMIVKEFLFGRHKADLESTKDAQEIQSRFRPA